MGKHRKQKNIKLRHALYAAGTAGAVAVPMIASTGSAHAASLQDWEKVAQCESGNRWNDPSVAGDGGAATGGLQFHQGSWSDAGGLKYASRPYLATKQQQILVAEKLLQLQGPGAWSCNSMVGSPLQRSGPHGSMYNGGINPYAGNVASAPPVRPPAPPAVVATSKAQIAIAFARAQIGKPYLWGGNGPAAFDCSGLTSAAWRAAGVSIPRTSGQQLAGLPRVSSPAPGDLVVYNFSGRVDHVALYTGPIGPGGADLIDTATRHPSGGVGWSKMSTRGGTVAGIVRPAPLERVATTPKAVTPTPKPVPKAPVAKKPHPHVITEDMRDSHTVVSGDTLWGIATEHIGHGTAWHEIYEQNKDQIKDPDLIYPGQVLKF